MKLNVIEGGGGVHFLEDPRPGGGIQSTFWPEGANGRWRGVAVTRRERHVMVPLHIANPAVYVADRMARAT